MFQWFLIVFDYDADFMWLINAFHCFLIYNTYELNQIHLLLLWNFSTISLTYPDTLYTKAILRIFCFQCYPYAVPLVVFSGFKDYNCVRVGFLDIPRILGKQRLWTHKSLEGKDIICIQLLIFQMIRLSPEHWRDMPKV